MRSVPAPCVSQKQEAARPQGAVGLGQQLPEGGGGAAGARALARTAPTEPVAREAEPSERISSGGGEVEERGRRAEGVAGRGEAVEAPVRCSSRRSKASRSSSERVVARAVATRSRASTTGSTRWA